MTLGKEKTIDKTTGFMIYFCLRLAYYLFGGDFILNFLAILLSLSTLTQAGNINTIEDGIEVVRKSDYCQSFSIENVPEPHSMLSGETRKWYNNRLSEIPEILKSEEYKSLSEKEKAIAASNLRNCFKHTARDAMKCASCANYLNANEKPLSFEFLERKYDRNYTKIIEKSYKSRESVNRLSKVSDFFEAHTPWLYENILFPVGMKISKNFPLTLSLCGIISAPLLALKSKISTKKAPERNVQELNFFRS